MAGASVAASTMSARRGHGQRSPRKSGAGGTASTGTKTVTVGGRKFKMTSRPAGAGGASSSAHHMQELMVQMEEMDLFDSLRPHLRAEKLFFDHEDWEMVPIRLDALKALARKWKLHGQPGFWKTHNTRLKLAKALHAHLQRHPPGGGRKRRGGSLIGGDSKASLGGPRSRRGGRALSRRDREEMAKYGQVLPQYEGDLFGTGGDYSDSLVYLSRYSRGESLEKSKDPYKFLPPPRPHGVMESTEEDEAAGASSSQMESGAEGPEGVAETTDADSDEGYDIEGRAAAAAAKLNGGAAGSDAEAADAQWASTSSLPAVAARPATSPPPSPDRSRKSALQARCARALRDLSRAPESRTRMISEGAIRALLDVLLDTTQGTVRLDCADALCNLSGAEFPPRDEDSETPLEGGLVAAVADLARGATHGQMRALCITTLYNLSCHLEFREQVVVEGAVPALLALLKPMSSGQSGTAAPVASTNNLAKLSPRRKIDWSKPPPVEVGEDAYVMDLCVRALCNLTTVPQGAIAIVESGVLSALCNFWFWMTPELQQAVAGTIMFAVTKSRGYAVKVAEEGAVRILAHIIQNVRNAVDPLERHTMRLAATALCRLTRVTLAARKVMAEQGVRAIMMAAVAASHSVNDGLKASDDLEALEGMPGVSKESMEPLAVQRICLEAISRLLSRPATVVAATVQGAVHAVASLLDCEDEESRHHCAVSLCNAFQHPDAALHAVRDGAIRALVRVVCADDERFDSALPVVAQALYNASCQRPSRHALMLSSSRVVEWLGRPRGRPKSRSGSRDGSGDDGPGSSSEAELEARSKGGEYETVIPALLTVMRRSMARLAKRGFQPAEAPPSSEEEVPAEKFQPGLPINMDGDTEVVHHCIATLRNITCSKAHHETIVSTGIIPDLIDMLELVKADGEDEVKRIGGRGATKLAKVPLATVTHVVNVLANLSGTAVCRNVLTEQGAMPAFIGLSSSSSESALSCAYRAAKQDVGAHLVPDSIREEALAAADEGKKPTDSEMRRLMQARVDEVFKKARMQCALGVCNLTCDTANHPALLELGVMPALMSLAAVGSDGDPIRISVAKAFHSLSDDLRVSQKMLDAGVAPSLVALSSSKSDSVRRDIAGTLFKLSQLETSDRILIDAGAVKALMVMALLRSHEPDTQRMAMQSVHNLMSDPKNRVEVLNHGVIYGLQHLAVSRDLPTQRACATVMYRIAEDPVAQGVLVANGGVRSVLSVLTQGKNAADEVVEGDDDEVYNIAAGESQDRLSARVRQAAEETDKLVSSLFSGVLSAVSQSEGNMDRLIQEGAAEVLVRLCTKYRPTEGGDQDGSGIDSDAREMAEAEGEGSLLSKDMFNLHSMRARCVKGLYHLSSSPHESHRRRLMKSEVVGIFCDLLCREDELMTTRYMCLLGVINMLWADDYRADVVAAGGLDAMIKVGPTADARFSYVIAASLHYASCFDDSKDRLSQGDAIKAMIRMIENSNTAAPDGDDLEAALRTDTAMLCVSALANVAAAEPVRELIVKEGGVPVIGNAMTKACDVASKIQADTLGAAVGSNDRVVAVASAAVLVDSAAVIVAYLAENNKFLETLVSGGIISAIAAVFACKQIPQKIHARVAIALRNLSWSRKARAAIVTENDGAFVTSIVALAAVPEPVIEDLRAKQAAMFPHDDLRTVTTRGTRDDSRSVSGDTVPGDSGESKGDGAGADAEAKGDDGIDDKASDAYSDSFDAGGDEGMEEAKGTEDSAVGAEAEGEADVKPIKTDKEDSGDSDAKAEVEDEVTPLREPPHGSGGLSPRRQSVSDIMQLATSEPLRRAPITSAAIQAHKAVQTDIFEQLRNCSARVLCNLSRDEVSRPVLVSAGVASGLIAVTNSPSCTPSLRATCLRALCSLSMESLSGGDGVEQTMREMLASAGADKSVTAPRAKSRFADGDSLDATAAAAATGEVVNQGAVAALIAGIGQTFEKDTELAISDDDDVEDDLTPLEKLGIDADRPMALFRPLTMDTVALSPEMRTASRPDRRLYERAGAALTGEKITRRLSVTLHSASWGRVDDEGQFKAPPAALGALLLGDDRAVPGRTPKRSQVWWPKLGSAKAAEPPKPVKISDKPSEPQLLGVSVPPPPPDAKQKAPRPSYDPSSSPRRAHGREEEGGIDELRALDWVPFTDAKDPTEWRRAVDPTQLETYFQSDPEKAHILQTTYVASQGGIVWGLKDQPKHMGGVATVAMKYLTPPGVEEDSEFSGDEEEKVEPPPKVRGRRTPSPDPAARRGHPGDVMVPRTGWSARNYSPEPGDEELAAAVAKDQPIIVRPQTLSLDRSYRNRELKLRNKHIAPEGSPSSNKGKSPSSTPRGSTMKSKAGATGGSLPPVSETPRTKQRKARSGKTLEEPTVVVSKRRPEHPGARRKAGLRTSASKSGSEAKYTTKLDSTAASKESDGETRTPKAPAARGRARESPRKTAHFVLPGIAGDAREHADGDESGEDADDEAGGEWAQADSPRTPRQAPASVDRPNTSDAAVHSASSPAFRRRRSPRRLRSSVSASGSSRGRRYRTIRASKASLASVPNTPLPGETLSEYHLRLSGRNLAGDVRSSVRDAARMLAREVTTHKVATRRLELDSSMTFASLTGNSLASGSITAGSSGMLGASMASLQRSSISPRSSRRSRGWSVSSGRGAAQIPKGLVGGTPLPTVYAVDRPVPRPATRTRRSIPIKREQLRARTLPEILAATHVAEEALGEVQDVSVRSIQRIARGMLGRRRASNVRRAKLAQQQALERGRAARERARRMRDPVVRGSAATRIQAIQRGHRARKIVQRIRAAVRLQSLQRGRLARRRVTHMAQQRQRRHSVASQAQAEEEEGSEAQPMTLAELAKAREFVVVDVDLQSLVAARLQLLTLTKEQLWAMTTFPQPPKMILSLVAAVTALLGIEPSWKQGVAALRNPSFVAWLLGLEQLDCTEEALASAKNILRRDEDLTLVAHMTSSSALNMPAVRALSQWVAVMTGSRVRRQQGGRLSSAGLVGLAPTAETVRLQQVRRGVVLAFASTHSIGKGEIDGAVTTATDRFLSIAGKDSSVPASAASTPRVPRARRRSSAATRPTGPVLLNKVCCDLAIKALLAVPREQFDQLAFIKRPPQELTHFSGLLTALFAMKPTWNSCKKLFGDTEFAASCAKFDPIKHVSANTRGFIRRVYHERRVFSTLRTHANLAVRALVVWVGTLVSDQETLQAIFEAERQREAKQKEATDLLRGGKTESAKKKEQLEMARKAASGQVAREEVILGIV